MEGGAETVDPVQRIIDIAVRELRGIFVEGKLRPTQLILSV